MNAIDAYFTNIAVVLDNVLTTQRDAMEQSAKLLADATLGDHNIFAFGCSHAGLLALEMYYRTGGLATINPVRAPGLTLDIDPATMTSQMERLPEYGRVIADNQPIGEGDVVIIHSVSGRNTVTVDFALRCREKGARVIALSGQYGVQHHGDVCEICVNGIHGAFISPFQLYMSLERQPSNGLRHSLSQLFESRL